MTRLFESAPLDRLTQLDRLAQIAWSQTWQLAALAAVVFVVTRLACRRHPHVAYLLWMLVVLKALVPPVWSSPSGAFSWALAETRTTPANVTQPLDLTTATLSLSPEAAAAANESISLIPAAAAVEMSLPWWEITTLALAGIWALGVFAITTVTAMRWWRLKQLLARSTAPVDPAVLQTFDELARRIVPRRRVQLLLTSAPIGPAAFGWWRGTVVVPRAIMAGKSSEELAPILAHELIHLRRFDTLAGSLQLLAQCLWWFHPAVWVANRQARLERERACDEAVVAELACSPAGYARLLVQILEWRQQLAVPLAWPSMRGIDVTTHRLQSMLEPARSFRRRAPAWSWVILLAAAALVLPGAGLQRTITAEPQSGEKEGSAKQVLEVTGTYTTAPADGQQPYYFYRTGEPPQVPAELKPVFAEFEKQGFKLYPSEFEGKLQLTGIFTKDFRSLQQPLALEKLPQLVHVDLNSHEDTSADQVVAKLKSLRNLSGETMLSISCNPAFATALNWLGTDIPGLRKLMLTSKLPPLVPPDEVGRTMRLDSLTKLEALTLSDADNSALAELQGLKDLKELTAFGPYTEEGLANLAGLTSLTNLMLAHASPSREPTVVPLDMAWADGLVNLQRVYVGSAFGLTDAGAARLAKLPAIDRLQLDEVMTDAGLDSLAECQQLRSLTLMLQASTKLTSAGFASLSKLTNLRQFYLHRLQSNAPPLVTDDVLKAWSAWSKLQVLTLADCRLTDASATAIRGWKSLAAFDVYGDAQFTDAGLAGWSDTLRRINLPIPQTTDAGFSAAFGHLINLRKLSLWQAKQITASALPALKPLAKLESLTLNGATLTGPQGAALAQWPELQYLSLTQSKLSDGAISNVARLPKLMVLDLTETNLNDNRLRLLTGLKELRELKLINTPITDAGLATLGTLASLQELWIEGTKTTETGRKEFSAAHRTISVNDGSGINVSITPTDIDSLPVE